MNCTRWFKFHKWGKWLVIEKGRLQYRYSEDEVGCFFVLQRSCEICGLTQYKHESIRTV